MSVSEPGKIITPWAESGLKNPIPPAANPATGRAGFDQGFSAINMTAKEAGGIPPFGQDFNGIFYEVTNILRYMQAGGQPTFSSALATTIGGYPKGAMVLGSDGVTLWQSKVDSNFTDPDTDPASWGTFDIGLKADLAAPGGSQLVGFQQSGTGAVARTANSKLREIVSVKDFGAVVDGVSDDTAAVTAAWNYAKTTSKSLHFPAGTYNLATISASLELSSGMAVYGDGMDSTIIKFNNTTGLPLFYRAAGLARLNSIEFRDLCIDGGHGEDGNYSQVGSYPLLINAVDTISLTRVKVKRSRTMAMALRGCTNVSVKDCVIQYCARDGINTADCSQVTITGNRIEFIDDDAIAGHTQIYNRVDRGYTISGNVIRFAQGIKLLGIQTASITGNTLEFCMGQGVSVASIASSGGVVEGVSAHSGITITGNTIKNMIDRAIVDGLNATAPYIAIGGAAQQAGGLSAIPGENIAGTASIAPLYDYFGNANNGVSTTPIPANYNVTITGNVLVRDIPASGALSALGYGMFYTRNGPIDPTLTEAGLRSNGVQFMGGITRKVVVSANNIAGIGSAVYMSSTAHALDVLVQANTLFDCSGAMAASQSNTRTHRVYFICNLIDLDPLLVHPNRGANGTYVAAGGPTAFIAQASKGYAIGGNVFRNIGRVADDNLNSTAVLSGTKFQLIGENYLECDFVGEGFNVGNKGIGECPRGPAFVYTVVDSDPASATYGQVLNHCPKSTSAVPSSGKWMRGHIVLNNNASATGTGGSQYVVSGWYRMTVGSGAALNTDWREMRTLTGT